MPQWPNYQPTTWCPPGTCGWCDKFRSDVMKFRKKPVEIEARQFTKGSAPGIGYEIASWCGGRFNTDVKPSDPTDVRYTISIPTLEGVMTASEGDWIIRGVHGEFYPCKSDIFEATYERVADDERTDSVSEVRGDEAP